MTGNPFTSAQGAVQYVIGRPDVHRLVTERIAARLELAKVAVDVACGTGLSTRALSGIAEQVYGFDSSPAMLEQARRAGGPARYLLAPAESLPLPDSQADLLTVSSAFHWLDRDAFLGEARRVLRPGGLLVLYDNMFRAELKDCSEFHSWFVERHLPRYPAPTRLDEPFGAAQAREAGFSFEEEQFRYTIPYSSRQLTDYLLTQSNLIRAVEEGRETWAGARSWLETELAPFFVNDEPGEFGFRGVIWWMPRLDGAETAAPQRR